jgi:hypothetical protein
VHPFLVIGSCSSEGDWQHLGDLGDRGDLQSLPRRCESPKEVLVNFVYGLSSIMSEIANRDS